MPFRGRAGFHKALRWKILPIHETWTALPGFLEVSSSEIGGYIALTFDQDSCSGAGVTLVKFGNDKKILHS